MAWSLDARIPVTLLPDMAAVEAALAEGKPAALVTAAPPPPKPARAAAAVSFAPGLAAHRAACACCQGRSPAAQALDRLFQARARGAAPWFERVLVLDEEGVGAELRRALREDALAAARFRAD
ncbi:hypothetical protein [Rubritepida flocculans]|uniref:hypothetical protein n=1 Tax=Rubritepida flocculans TaxID=182403 RepID=UPI00040EFF65|nr:hypothetical protein [Rubritepida flocculans]